MAQLLVVGFKKDMYGLMGALIGLTLAAIPFTGGRAPRGFPGPSQSSGAQGNGWKHRTVEVRHG